MKSAPKKARTKVWKSNVGEKLRLSFSKTRLEDNITKLRAYNEDFRVLALQARQAVPQAKNLCSRLSRNLRSNVRKYQTIGNASCRVYEALQRSCTKHAEHTAYFSMEVEHVFLEKDSKPQVKFEMAFTHQASINTINSGDPVWFLLCSKMTEQVAACADIQAECMLKLSKSLKHQLDDEAVPVKVKTVKKVRFENPTLHLTTQPSAPLLVAPPIILGNTITIDFCDYLRHHLVHDTCVVLKRTEACEQLVSTSGLTGSTCSRKAISLGQLIAQSRNSVGGFGILERVSLARTLAVAVLQYHSTPWFLLSCSSDGILFFDVVGKATSERTLTIASPYFNARIRSNDKEQPARYQPAMVGFEPRFPPHL